MIRVLPEGHTVRFEHGRYEAGVVNTLLDNYRQRAALYGRRAALTRLHAESVSLQSITTWEKGTEISPWGGATVARIFDAEGNEVAMSFAQCSLFDNFSKPLGRTIALGRALKQLETDRGVAA